MTDFLQNHPDGIVLAVDEMSLYFQATLTRAWSFVGQTPIVAVHPQRDHIHFYGALNLCNGREIALPALAANSELSANFVRLLLMLYPQPIFLLLDRAPWHYGEVTILLEQTDRLHICYLPPACPDLNPQEHIWKQTRAAISHNHTYRQFQTLIDDFEQYLNETLFSSNFIDAFTPLGLGAF